MPKHDDSQKRSLTRSGRARRRFLEGTALAAAGTSAALLPVLHTATAATPSGAASDACPAGPAPMREVEGRVAFITGGDSGIGLGIARAFADAGMKVVITYRTKAHLEEALKYLEG